MEKELGADVIKATQSSLGKYVKRPPLTEKLLKKPPFRFLHDIITSVHKTTGFFEGLFEEGELISDNVKDRESKIHFLNKVISVIGTTTGKSLNVKSSKIVAGQEADKTNELLQNLALALDKKLSSDVAVKQYKESSINAVTLTKSKDKDPNNKLLNKPNDPKKLTSRSSEKLSNNKKVTGPANKIDNEPKIKKKESNVVKNDTQSKKSQQPRTKNSIPDKNKVTTELKVNKKIAKRDSEDEQNEETKRDVKDNNIIISEESLIKESVNETNANDILDNINNEEVEVGESEPDFTKEVNELEVKNEILTQPPPGSPEIEPLEMAIEPVEIKNDQHNSKLITATKEVPSTPIKNIEPIARNESTDSVDNKSELEKHKILDKSINNSSRKNSDVVRPPSVRPPSSRPGAPRLREKIDNSVPESDNLLLAKVNIIAENGNNDEEEDASVIFVEQQSLAEHSENHQDQLQLTSNAHGHLVQQILDSQKEFSQIGKTEIEWQFGALKAKEAVNQEIEQLRFNIQALSRGANPLGKLLDHIQEDAEVMRQELQQWTNAYDEVTKEMQKQKTANEETLFPLSSRLKQLDADIQEKRDKINDFKILIHKNVSRIEKLLLNGNVQ